MNFPPKWSVRDLCHFGVKLDYFFFEGGIKGENFYWFFHVSDHQFGGVLFILVKLINYGTPQSVENSMKMIIVFEPIPTCSVQKGRCYKLGGFQQIRTFLVGGFWNFPYFANACSCTRDRYSVLTGLIPPILIKNSKLPSNILTISDNILI